METEAAELIEGLPRHGWGLFQAGDIRPAMNAYVFVDKHTNCISILFKDGGSIEADPEHFNGDIAPFSS